MMDIMYMDHTKIMQLLRAINLSFTMITIPKGTYGNLTFTAHWKIHTRKIKIDDEKEVEADYDDDIELDIPEKDGYEFLYFETDDGQKIYDGKLHIGDKDYTIKTVWAEIPKMELPKTGEEKNHILLIIYILITITSFGFALDLATESKRRK